jgi:hypothetical protein
MTRYNVFEQLAELTKLTKTEEGYSKFIQKGEIEFYDYNRGYFDVDIYAYQNHMNKMWFVRIWIGTIDDGDYGGWQEVTSKGEADVVVEQIAQGVFKDMVAFPSLAELNKQLIVYGMAVGYE